MQRNTTYKSPIINTEQLSKEEIIEAIANDYILPYFQPQVYINGHVRGFEVLARLDIPQRGIVRPAHFISQCIKYGILKPLFQKLFVKSLDGLEKFNQTYEHYKYTLSVNISNSQLKDSDFSQWLFDTLGNYDVKLEQLIIELTESQAQESGANELDNLSRLRLGGIKISIDDFGTGFSNLDTLTELEFDEVKLDRSFAHGVSGDKVSQIIIDSLIKIVKEINAELVVEGIENIKDLNFLHEAGCEIYQGYIFCRPKPFNEVARWLEVTVRHCAFKALN